jgi:crotonobetaine/carnitine-CoA ligase
MLGYLNNLPATLRAFRNLWFHTGDAGRLGPDGELHFQGRMGDTIRRRGVNVSSEQVESEVLRHANVRDCAVIGVPSPLGEEDIQACIVWRRKPGLIDDAIAELLAFLQDRLPRGYLPRYLECLESLPMTETGKVRKPELRARKTMERRWDREASAWV